MMSLEKQLNEEMLAAFDKAGKETGYWGRYYLRSVFRSSRGCAPGRESDGALPHLT